MAGLHWTEAQTLVDTYAKPRPIMEVFPLAFDILDARWNGTPEAPPATQDDLRHAAASGDMADTINETLNDAGL
ncbi:MAG: hypothetical protein U5N27_18315 [Rhizobium sp.]|nr:hypothetical protein [Rhizobium sp.]